MDVLHQLACDSSDVVIVARYQCRMCDLSLLNE